MSNVMHLLGHQKRTPKKANLRRLSYLRTEKEKLGAIEPTEGALGVAVEAGLVFCADCGSLLDWSDEEEERCRRCGSSEIEIRELAAWEGGSR